VQRRYFKSVKKHLKRQRFGLLLKRQRTLKQDFKALSLKEMHLKR
jgi:hypothetical protein